MAVISAGSSRPWSSSVTGAATSGSGEMVRTSGPAGATVDGAGGAAVSVASMGMARARAREALAARTSCLVPPSTARAWRAPRRRISAFRSTFQRSSQ